MRSLAGAQRRIEAALQKIFAILPAAFRFPEGPRES
jgi:hypothetical protein